MKKYEKPFVCHPDMKFCWRECREYLYDAYSERDNIPLAK